VHLCGDILPSVVFSGCLSLGRAGLILSYEGKSLDRVPTYITAQTYMKAKLVLQKLRSNGVIHADIASRNIVVGTNGDVKLINLGNAYKMDQDGSELAKRMEMDRFKEVFETPMEYD